MPRPLRAEARETAAAFHHLHQVNPAWRFAQQAISDFEPREGLPNSADILGETWNQAQQNGDYSAVGDILLRREGGLWGRMVRTGELPDADRVGLDGLLKGDGPITRDGIDFAYRLTQRPFVEGLLGEIGVTPLGRPHHVKMTRLVPLPRVGDLAGRPVFAKLETEQEVESFKGRAALGLVGLMVLLGLKPKVCAASHGNWAQGLARALQMYGFDDLELFLPANTPQVKVDLCRRMLSTEVRLVGKSYEDAEDAARAWQAESPTDRFFAPPFDHPMVAMAGGGSLGVEIALQMERLGHQSYGVVFNGGGGGMGAGLATYLAPRGILVVGAEATSHMMLSISYRAGRTVQHHESRHIPTVAQGIALLRPGERVVPAILQNAKGMFPVPETEVEMAIALFDEEGYRVEGAGAVGVAAVASGAVEFASRGLKAGAPVVVIASGGHIEEADFERVKRSHSPDVTAKFRRFREARRKIETDLTAHGLMDQGTVVPLQTVSQGRNLIDIVAKNLPAEWDLIDGLERLDWGPWEEKPVSLNARLRGYAMYRMRWDGNKMAALMRPLTERSPLVIDFDDRYRPGRTPLSSLAGRFAQVRDLLVEAEIIAYYMNSDRSELGVRRAFEGVHARWQHGFGALAKRLAITLDDFATMTGQKFDELIASAG